MALSAIERAIWHIEAHLSDPFSLEETARAAGVSKFHLSRVFGLLIGMSPSAFVRGRRLTRAAHDLAAGAPDILSVALDAGYGSHEAFTRAFRAQFGLAPETVRENGSVETLSLVEAKTMSDLPTIAIAEPEIVERGPILAAGLEERFSFSERGSIPTLWQKFMPLMMQIPDIRPGTTYGVMSGSVMGEDGFDYAAVIAVESIDDIPSGLSAVRIPRLNCAVFRHGGHVAEVGAVCNAIYTDWVPRSDQRPAEGPIQMIEHYPASFNAMTGEGGFEIWLPLSD